MSTLTTNHLKISYDTVTIVEDLNLVIPKGQITVLIGSNGSGKSTILRSLARLLKPDSGQILMNGKETTSIPPKEFAKKLSILPQGPQAPEGLTVKELCYYGRHPHKGFFSRNSEEDHRMVNWALEATRMKELEERSLDALSGGQRQRAWIAMSLAQGTEILLLDEPTTYLDLSHQIEVLNLLRVLNKKHHKTIVMVLHDLNHAARYAHNLVCINKGSIYACGDPNTVFTEEMIQDVFRLKSLIISDPVEHTPMCVPIEICYDK